MSPKSTRFFLFATFCLASLSAPVSAQTFTVLHNLSNSTGATGNGLILASNGQLYGTAGTGGTTGYGTAYTITTDGAFTVLDQFDRVSGENPNLNLTPASDGNLYGVTGNAGAFNGGGTVFRLGLDGSFATIYSFCAIRQHSDCQDGEVPEPLIQGSDGNFYGTTTFGGPLDSTTCIYRTGCGTVFKLTPDGVLTTMHNFCQLSGCTDGASPNSALVQGSDGNFYGVTYIGGTSTRPLGTVYRLSPDGSFTTLYSFCAQPGCTDGFYPDQALVQASDGNLYGATAGEGTSGATVFRITPDGALTTIHTFNGTDGTTPSNGGMLQGNDGFLYGLTIKGGASNRGTIYRISTDGAFTSLYSFCSQASCSDGKFPAGTLTQAPDGTLYGTTVQGGRSGVGVIYKLALP